jgi:hypothetical protein
VQNVVYMFWSTDGRCALFAPPNPCLSTTLHAGLPSSIIVPPTNQQ